jgi:hypothetical protein
MNEEPTKEQEALNKYFEDSETVTAQLVLYNEFNATYKLGVNKFQMYILFGQGRRQPTGKAEDGSLGYYKKVKAQS